MSHTNTHLREAFQDLIDSVGVDDLRGDTPVVIDGEQKDATWLFGKLWHCTDTLPAYYCDELDIPKGSTYAAAAQTFAGKVSSPTMDEVLDYPGDMTPLFMSYYSNQQGEEWAKDSVCERCHCHLEFEHHPLCDDKSQSTQDILKSIHNDPYEGFNQTWLYCQKPPTPILQAMRKQWAEMLAETKVEMQAEDKNL